MRPQVLALLFAVLSLGAQAAEPEFDAVTGYRIARYRSPVPPHVEGGQRVSAADIDSLVAERSAILIDVMPSEGPGPDIQTGQWLVFKPRRNIPGSVWLPDVGKGVLTPLMDGYFRQNLKRLTNGDLARAIVLYCQADCWMSWNAIKRAASYGYKALFWFPEGSDGWRDWDGRFSNAMPVPLTPEDATP